MDGIVWSAGGVVSHEKLLKKFVRRENHVR